MGRERIHRRRRPGRDLVAPILIAAVWLLIAAAAWRVGRRIPPLPADRVVHPGLVSVVIPARNEEAAVGDCIESILAQQDCRLEVIAVNDGSTDRTGLILDAIAERDARLTVLHNPPLPAGWLGKPNAQWRAVAVARGEWIVFADADIMFEADAVSRALREAADRRLDGLSLLPRLITGSWSEAAVLPLLPIAILALRPDSANTPGSGGGFAAGAFMLVRRSAYDAIGGHAAVRDQVIEDVALGRLLKNAGHRFRVYLGVTAIAVRMYTGIRSLLFGMVKNVSFVLGGRRGSPVLAPASAFAFACFASAGPVLTITGWLRGHALDALAGIAVWLTPMVALPGLVRSARFDWWPLPLYPVAAWLVFLATCIASWYRLVRGTIRWRDREVELREPIAGASGPGDLPRS